MTLWIILTIILTTFVVAPIAHRSGYLEGKQDQRTEDYVKRMQERPYD